MSISSTTTTTATATTSNPFKAIHRDYKRLNRIKALVRLQSNNRSDIIDIFEVYSYRLKELLAKVETDGANDAYSEPTQIRLASIQLALLYDHLDVLMYSSSLSLSKESSTAALPPPPPTAIINAELEKTIQCMQTYHRFRFNDILSFVYLKLYNLLAKIAFQALQNFNIARQLLDCAQQMYMEMLEQQHEKQQYQYYGWRQLFAKSSKLKPAATISQFDEIEKLFAESSALLEKIEQIEAERENDSNDVAVVVESADDEGDGNGNGDESNDEFQTVFDSIQADQDYSILLGKLLSIIPVMLKQQQWKTSAYLLLMTQKLTIGSIAMEAEKTSPMVDVKVRSSIVTNWMRYIFGVFSNSELNWQHLCSSSAGKMRFLPKFANEKPSNNEASPKTELNFQIIFNFFAEIVPLASDELQFCVDSMQSIADGQRLIEYTLKMMEHLLNDSDFRSYPMDFIIHHYQMSDLLSIAIILTFDQNRCFEYQLERFHYFNQMMRTLQKYCPKLYATLVRSFMSDLNEIILDLYAVNCDRFEAIDNKEDDDNTDGDGDGGNKNKNQNRMHNHQCQIIAKLNELHAMTQQLMTSIKPI